MRDLPSDQPGFYQIFLGPASSGWYFKWNCPCGCGFVGTVPLNLTTDPANCRAGSHRWEWDGNLEHPTVSPSFKSTLPCGSHFNLNAGVYTIHADGAPAAATLYRAP